MLIQPTLPTIFSTEPGLWWHAPAYIHCAWCRNTSAGATASMNIEITHKSRNNSQSLLLPGILPADKHSNFCKPLPSLGGTILATAHWYGPYGLRCALLPQAQAMLAWPDLTEVCDRLYVLQIPDRLTIRSLGSSFSSLLFTNLFICLEHKIQREKVKSLF